MDNKDNNNPVSKFIANMVIICVGMAVCAIALGLAFAFLSWIF